MTLNRLNGTITASNYGARRVTVERIAYGIDFIADEDQTRMGRAYYPKQVAAQQFQLGIVCASHHEAHGLATWLKGWGDRAASGSAQVGPLRVTVPSRKFDRVGVLTTGVEFGDARTTLVHRMTLTFAAAGEPVGSFGEVEIKAVGASQFSMPADETKTLPHFYPGGIQLSGLDQGDDLLYDRGVGTPEDIQRQIDLADTDNEVFARNKGK